MFMDLNLPLGPGVPDDGERERLLVPLGAVSSRHDYEQLTQNIGGVPDFRSPSGLHQGS